VKKTTCQNLWPRINSLIKTARSTVTKNCAARGFFWRHQPRNFENITLVARRRENFRGFLVIFLVAQLSPKRGVFSTPEFTRFLSTVSSQRRATRSDVFFQTL